MSDRAVPIAAVADRTLPSPLRIRIHSGSVSEVAA
jgi:hypothetical protein